MSDDRCPRVARLELLELDAGGGRRRVGLYCPPHFHVTRAGFDLVGSRTSLAIPEQPAGQCEAIGAVPWSPAAPPPLEE